ncbi:MAG: PIG-L deacetylase family protein [Chloroflexota bacterium]|nr:PIG-L deacetylase family protein [Chloroflexota bacterium]
MNTSDSKPTILSVLAHPDDETFGMGGTLALYAQRGMPVHLICATRGEVGVVDPEYLEGFESVAALREHELRCAAGILGLAGVHFLDYRDSGMSGSEDNHHPKALAAAPVDEVAAQIAHYIRRLKPQVVLTFDPIGGYHHPDHIAIHNAAVRAFELADDNSFPTNGLPAYRPDGLYYHIMPRGYLRWLVRLMPLLGRDPRRYGRNEDIDLVALSRDDFPVHAVIDYKSVKGLKEQATACHASQGGTGTSRGVWGWIRRLRGDKDHFMRAYPPPNSRRRAKDLFEGLDHVSSR